ncbi:MAG: SRPBCC domain-containing protein [Bacteroidetes bacterium]|nr:SRPBCC domain-containing protein [Bacteroidota bacterium]
MKQIITQQFIQAKPETVWNILMETQSYADWNPFIVKMEGTPGMGAQLTNTMMQGKNPMTFKPRVTAFNEGEYFEWLGSMPLNMFNGRHFFRLSSANGGTLLEHGEYFAGWCAGLILKKIGDETRNGFIAMNKALCERAEKA